MNKQPVAFATLVQKTMEALNDKKAQNPTHLPLPADCSMAKSLVIATATSERHAHTLATVAADAIKATGEPTPAIEGASASQWILIDAGDLIVHIFLEEARKLYNLEKLWADVGESTPNPATTLTQAS